MNCEKCEAPLSYGTKYCNTCGEKVPKGAYDAEYNDTIWAKIDKVKDEYDSLAFKKITGNIIFKIVVLLVVVGYFFFAMYGNLNGIRLKENKAYTISYNTKLDEYYIYPNGAKANLEMYAPIGTDKLVFTAMTGGKIADEKTFTVEQYEKEGYEVKEGQYDYIIIKALRGKKTADDIKVLVVK